MSPKKTRLAINTSSGFRLRRQHVEMLVRCPSVLGGNSLAHVRNIAVSRFPDLLGE
jgi:hypothetical protein